MFSKIYHLQSILNSPLMNTDSDAAGSVAEVKNLVAGAVNEKFQRLIFLTLKHVRTIASNHAIRSCCRRIVLYRNNGS
jgi:hypothetical protein